MDAPEVMQRLEALLQRNRTLQRSAKRAAACVTPPQGGASASSKPPCLDTERRLQALEDACSVLRSDLSHFEGCSKGWEAASASFGGLDQRVWNLEVRWLKSSRGPTPGRAGAVPPHSAQGGAR